jgi:hypothetical protein
MARTQSSCPFGTGASYLSLPRHFVPGYDQLVPPGHRPRFFKILLGRGYHHSVPSSVARRAMADRPGQVIANRP